MQTEFNFSMAATNKSEDISRHEMDDAQHR